jgi:hypothetical protein
MNFLAGILIAWFCFHYLSVVEAMIVKPASEEIVRRVLEPRPDRLHEEVVILPTKPRDPQKDAFMETCPKYGFSQTKCAYIWSHEDDQTALTPAAKGVKIEVSETPLIEEKE